MTFREHNRLRSQAAAIKNWYWVAIPGLLGHWEQLTLTQATQRALKVVGAGGTFRKATVDEELDLDGI